MFISISSQNKYLMLVPRSDKNIVFFIFCHKISSFNFNLLFQISFFIKHNQLFEVVANKDISILINKHSFWIEIFDLRTSFNFTNQVSFCSSKHSHFLFTTTANNNISLSWINSNSP